jgi:hypothetical protein
MTTTLRGCPHNARTDALSCSRQARRIPARAVACVAGQAAFAALRSRIRHESKRSANAVWVRAHPGFKSPSLRHCDQGFRADGAEPLIHVSDHYRLQMTH